jgi:hypothetical protein
MTQNGTSQVEGIILELLELIQKLTAFSSFAPSPELDDVLGQISHICHKSEVSVSQEDEVSDQSSLLSAAVSNCTPSDSERPSYH